MRQVGTAVGAALIGTILLVGLNTGTQERLAALPGVPAAAAEQVAAAIQASDGQALVVLRQDPRAAAMVPEIELAFADAARTAALVASGFIGLGLLFSLLLPAPATERGEEPVVIDRGDAEPARRGRLVPEPVVAD